MNKTFVGRLNAWLAAARVYDPAPPPGWELDINFGTSGVLATGTGFFAYALKPLSTNNTVDPTSRLLVFRGTELSDLRDIYADASDVGRDQFLSAQEKINSYLVQEIEAQRHVELVGHSLGGALVQWTVEKSNLESLSAATPGKNVAEFLRITTFNAPGITLALGADPQNPRSSAIEGTHYVIGMEPSEGFTGDPVHLLGGRHVGGNLVAINGSAFFAHSIENPIWASENISVISNYRYNEIDVSHAQAFSRLVESLHGVDGRIKNHNEARLKLQLVLSWTAVVKAGSLSALPIALATSMEVAITKLAAEEGIGSIFNAMSHIVREAAKTGQNVAEVALGLQTILANLIEKSVGITAEFASALGDGLQDFGTDLAKGIANSFSGLVDKFESTFDFGTNLSLAAYRALTDPFNPPAGNTAVGSMGGLLGKERDIVHAGGQAIAMFAGSSAANPFDDPGFDPQMVSVALNVKRWAVRTITLYLPFEAGKDGQAIKLQLSGSAASSFALLNPELGRVSLSGDGGYTLTIAPGSRQVTISLLLEDDISEDSTLTLAATPVGPDGVPTHQTLQNISLNVIDDDTETEQPPEPTLTPVTGKTATRIEDGVEVQYMEYRGDDTGNLVVTGDGLNSVWVGDGPNSVIGGSGEDGIYSGTGNSTISAGAGDDVIVTDGGGDNIISAGGGQDIVVTGYGNSEIYANTKVDIETALEEAAGATGTGTKGIFVAVTEGDNTIVGGNGNDAIILGGGDNVVIAGAGSDTIVGGQIAGGMTHDWEIKLVETSEGAFDLVYENVGLVETSGGYVADESYQGNVDVDGNPLGLGNNTIFGGSGDHLILLSNGNNFVDIGSGATSVFGGMGDDTILGGSGESVILGGGGNDYIRAGSGNSEIVGGSGNNQIFGGSGTSTIYAGSAGANGATRNEGNNFVAAGSGATTIYGSGGNDTLMGGDGNDTIVAGDGNATIMGGGGADHLEGGAGTNTIYASHGGVAGKEAKVLAGSGTTTVYGGDGVTHILGGSGINTLYAGDGGDAAAPTVVQAGSGDTTIYGGSGVNVLRGGDGNDIIYAGIGGTASAPTVVVAGAGNDTLVAGTGTSVLYGGSGHTSFVLNGAGNTTIAESEESDTIVLSGVSNASEVSVTAQMYDNGDVALVLNTGQGAVNIMNGFAQGAGNYQLLSSGGARLRQAASVLSLQQLMTQSATTPQHFVGANSELAFTAAAGDTLVAQGNNSQLYAFGDGSTLVAGAGTSKLYGGGGNSTFVVNTETSYTEIPRSVSSDKLKLGSGILPMDVTVKAGEAGAVALKLAEGGSIVVHRDASGMMLERVEFGDGGTTTMSDLTSGEAEIAYADGSHSILATDLTGTTKLTKFSASGVKLSETWRSTDGGTGSSSFNADGSSTGEITHADGTTSTMTNDGQGHVTLRHFDTSGKFTGSTVTVIDSTGEFSEIFDASGNKTGIKWRRPDGSSGQEIFNADGSSNGVTYRPDGSFTVYTKDSNGELDSVHYDSQGEVADRDHDAAERTRFDNPDGSYRLVADDGAGNEFVTYFDRHGDKFRESWQKSDGSFGDDFFNADGSGSGTAYDADGSYKTYTLDIYGHTTTVTYDWKGNRTGTIDSQLNGASNVITTFRNASGTKLAETWTHSDGSSGTNPVQQVDYLGRTSMFQNLPVWAQINWGSFESGYYGGTRTGQPPYWTGSVYSVWQKEYSLDVTVYQNSSSYNSLAYGFFWSGITGVQYEVDVSKSGGLKIWGSYWDGRQFSYVTGNTLSMRNGQSVFHADGSGNISITEYQGGQRATVMWMHNDGSYGFDTYFGGGLSGMAHDMFGNGTRYTRGADGSLVRNPLAPLPVESTNSADGAVAHRPAPTLGSKPDIPGGTGSWGNSSMTVEGSGGEKITLNFSFFGGISQTTSNLASGTTTLVNGGGTGFRTLAAAAATGTSGWKIDADGNMTGSFKDAGNGTVTSYDYNAAGHLSGRSVATTNSSGTTTLRYDAAGRLLGKSVQTTDAQGMSVTATFDSAGILVGTVKSASDANGNRVSYSFDAAGVLVASSTIELTGANEVTITNFNRQGSPSGARVVTQMSDGSIHTANYDAAGKLTGSTLKRQDGTAIETSSYDAQGRLLGYVLLSPTVGGGYQSRAYDGSGQLIRDNKFSPTNELVEQLPLPDGGQQTITYKADRSYTTTIKDAAGNVETTSYSPAGEKLSRSWSRVAGETGTATITNGLESGTVVNADQSKSSYTTAADGTVTTKHYAAWGTYTGKTVTSDTGGNVMSVTYDDANRKTGDVWRNVDGTSGSSKFNYDGSRVLTVHDGHGKTTNTTLNNAGVVTAVSWTTDEGLAGTRTYNADRSSTVVETDAAGTTTTTLYNAQGLKVSATWRRADFSFGTDTFRSDGSSTRVAYTARMTTTEYDAEGRRLSDVWVNGDIEGANTYHLDGSSDGITRNPDGSVETMKVKPDGSYTTRLVDAAGNVTTSQFNENGFMLSKQWTNADGTSGSESFTAPESTPQLVNPLRSQNVGPGDKFVLALSSGTFVESEPGNTLVYSLAMADGSALPAWLKFNPYTGALSGYAPEGETAPLHLKLTATEMRGLHTSTTFKLTVSDSSAPVVNNPIADQEADELVEFRFVIPAGTFEDLDGGDLAYSAKLADGSPLPAWLAFDAATGTFTGVPGDELVGSSLELVVTATDEDGMAVSDSFKLGIKALDTLYTAVSMVLPSHVKNLTGTGSADIVLTGNSLANIITANDGNDTLVAGTGSATLVGGIGNDTFIINKESDVVIEAAGDDVNTLLTPVSYVLPENVQHLQGTGSASITLTGNAGVHRITANDAGNTLVAGSGAATLVGGAGNDIFVVNKASDVVIDEAGSNIIMTSVSYILPEHVQGLVATGDNGLELKGNAAAHAISGGAGNDTLVAGTGQATLSGGAGDDTYRVNSTSDVITEEAEGGYDIVLTAVDYVMPAHLEKAMATGESDIALTGNAGTHVLVANGGNDTLIAGTGEATLIGGAGNTTFVISSDTHHVEAGAGGVNTVVTSVDYTAGEHVTNVSGQGISGLVLEGNALDNFIRGADGNDTLRAGAGSDTLEGGLGDDVLIGGSGTTTFVFSSGSGLDQIVAGDGASSVRLGAGLSVGNMRITLWQADGTYYPVVKDGKSGRIHGARPNHGALQLTAHLQMLDEHGERLPGQGLTFSVSADDKGVLTSEFDAFEFVDGGTAGFEQLLEITHQGDARSGLVETAPVAATPGEASQPVVAVPVAGLAAVTAWNLMDVRLDAHIFENGRAGIASLSEHHVQAQLGKQPLAASSQRLAQRGHALDEHAVN